MQQLHPFRLARTVALAAALAASCMTSSGAQAAPQYLKVSGLPAGHVLWIRSAPGRSFERIGFLPPTARHIRSYGCKRLATGSWCQLRYRSTKGWALRRYLAPDTIRRL